MNWYIKQIFAQTAGLQRFLETLRVTPDIIQYILSLDKDTAQYLTNEVRKNPAMTLEQVQSFQLPQKKNPYTENELKLVERFPQEIQKWILVNLRRIRGGHDIDKIYSDPKLSDTIFQRYSSLINFLDLISDWATRADPKPDLNSYSPEQAVRAQDDWHKMMAGKGEGVAYEPTKQENIVYGPKWSNPRWQGWTVQEVTTENDLLAEGNKMNHCVGSYSDNVKDGTSVIFSLRDHNNKPHVTMEVEGGPGNIVQIMGNSNTDPDKILKEMIKEFITNKSEGTGIRRKINTFEQLEENADYDGISVQQMTDAINNILQGEENEYGLKYIFDTDLDTLMDQMIETGEGESSGYGNRASEYRGDIVEASPYISNLALMLDLNLDHWPRHSGEWEELRKMPKQSDWKNIQEIEQFAWGAIDEIQEDFYQYGTGLEYPQEEDFENPEEYEEAMERYQEAESEIHTEWLKQSVKGGFSIDLLDELKSLRKSGIIPSSKELYEMKKKKQEEDIINSPAYQEGLSKGQQMVNNALETV